MESDQVYELLKGEIAERKASYLDDVFMVYDEDRENEYIVQDSWIDGEILSRWASFLHPDYHQLGVTVRIESRKRYIKRRLFELKVTTLKERLLDVSVVWRVDSLYDIKSNEIVVFTEASGKDEWEQVANLSWSLYYHLRQSWQMKYRKSWVEREYVPAWYSEEVNSLEKDAMLFSLRMLRKQRDKIEYSVGL